MFIIQKVRSRDCVESFDRVCVSFRSFTLPSFKFTDVYRSMTPLIVKVGPKLPESPNTKRRLATITETMARKTGILTNETVVVASHNVWDSHLHTSGGEFESMADDDWCLDVTRPQKDEPVVVSDVCGFAREIPE